MSLLLLLRGTPGRASLASGAAASAAAAVATVTPSATATLAAPGVATARIGVTA